MREKYETLAIKDLRAIAKIRGVKGASSMSKGQVIEVLLLLDETEEKAKLAAEADDAIRAEEAKRAVMSRSKKSSDTADAGDVKKPRGRKPAAKAEEASETKPATEAKPASSDAKPVAGTSDERAKALIDEAFERQARLNPDKTPEELKAAYFEKKAKEEEERNVDSGIPAHGILEIMPDGFGFIRCENFLPGENDVYVAPGIIRKYGLRTGDIIKGSTKVKTQNEKFSALLSLTLVNGFDPETISKRVSFENMTPIFPDNRIRLEMPGSTVAMRVMDLLSPVGKGQRGMIVSPPKAGKTTLLKEVAKSVKRNNPEIHLIILLIDERPEEVTDIKEAIEGPNVEVIYSTFDELPEHHKRVSEMVIERAKRLVEHHKDVMILLDSITRLTRAYNLTVPPSGRTLSGGLDPAALHMPKRFFGAARNMREGGSLTILATALVETGSKMDDVVYEEFKGTGNMEMVLDRKLSEKRIFPAIDIAKSGTRRDDLLLTKEEIDAVNMLRKGINGLKPEESVDRILDMFAKTRGNNDFIHMVNKIQLF
ncbi:MAG: transcription termination factor Rho [Lachnospiraceae bacterium]|nr:transcription termination factor Rho [Lachnospiraceae bacterium]MBR5760968.1 transcription termination factor Rho [Lachnospiraceae bacterium]